MSTQAITSANNLQEFLANSEKDQYSWMAIVVHGVEGLPVLVLTLAVILGLVTG